MREVSERKGFAAGRSSIHGRQGKTPQKPSREISPAASVNKSIKGNNNNNEKPDMKISNHEHDTFSPSAPLLTNSCFPSASRRFSSSQKRRKARIIASNTHRPFAALRFLTICSGRLFFLSKRKKNKHGLNSFHFLFGILLFFVSRGSYLFHGAAAARHDKPNQGYRAEGLCAAIYSATSEEQLTRKSGWIEKKELGEVLVYLEEIHVYIFIDLSIYCDLPRSALKNHCTLCACCHYRGPPSTFSPPCGSCR